MITIKKNRRFKHDGRYHAYCMDIYHNSKCYTEDDRIIALLVILGYCLRVRRVPRMPAVLWMLHDIYIEGEAHE